MQLFDPQIFSVFRAKGKKHPSVYFFAFMFLFRIQDLPHILPREFLPVINLGRRNFYFPPVLEKWARQTQGFSEHTRSWFGKAKWFPFWVGWGQVTLTLTGSLNHNGPPPLVPCWGKMKAQPFFPTPFFPMPEEHQKILVLSEVPPQQG